MTAPLLELLPLWRASLKASGRSPRTIRSYVDAVTAFARRLGEGSGLTQVTRQTIAAYQNAIGANRNPKTVGLHLTAIRAFCRWAIDSDLREDDPTARITWPKVSQRLPGRALTRAQVRQLIAALAVPDGLPPTEDYQRRRNRVAVLLMLYAGLRLSEAAALRVADVDLEAGALVVRSGKGNKDRAVPLHPALAVELRAAVAGRDQSHAVVGKRDGSALSGKSLAHIFERYIPSFGLPFRVTAHQLRHNFCQGLIENAAQLPAVQELMGHSDPRTTGRYYRLSAGHLQATIRQLPDW